jgi:hypothetical protein
VMFANSRNVNINGGEFHVTYAPETAQKGKDIFVQFLCLQI